MLSVPGFLRCIFATKQDLGAAMGGGSLPQLPKVALGLGWISCCPQSDAWGLHTRNGSAQSLHIGQEGEDVKRQGAPRLAWEDFP